MLNYKLQMFYLLYYYFKTTSKSVEKGEAATCDLLCNSRSIGGFTLIELLVVIIIIGILSAIALPTFLSQSNKARQVEAKQNLSALNRAQQLYYAENGNFITNISESGRLAIGLKPETVNYSYSIKTVGDSFGVANLANPKNNRSLKSYVGGVGLNYQPGATELTTLSVLCESNESGVILDSNNVTVVLGVSVKGGGNVSCSGTTRELQ